MSAPKAAGLIKVLFEVDTGDGPLPQLGIESMWAEQTGPTMARLCNVPFFACGVALGDLVQIEQAADGAWKFVEVVQAAEASTLHAFAFSQDEKKQVIDRFAAQGCIVETGPTPAYLAIHIPSLAAARWAADLIAEYQGNDQVAFQVSCSRHEPVLVSDV
ncbi:DUF4265 domain-containing protein [Chitiniphilus purpureus]|uniref:DUF4265 domain-containing protein n=1 Tax=Chitiniphilus purpureus TaxID=2981137 RepID=A0ABY6DMJ2_9NEIS|nr:DUF4265 domain-containing protein [Chitiniphilus sp. CD1]UXY15227.1 DUF4265 domain-containing protein [Chitiniphilus sp. CD1]